MVWERYCNASPKPQFFLFSFFIFSFISQLIWVHLGWNFHRWFSIQKQVNWCTTDPFSLYFAKPTLTQYLKLHTSCYGFERDSLMFKVIKICNCASVPFAIWGVWGFRGQNCNQIANKFFSNVQNRLFNIWKNNLLNMLLWTSSRGSVFYFPPCGLFFNRKTNVESQAQIKFVVQFQKQCLLSLLYPFLY